MSVLSLLYCDVSACLVIWSLVQGSGSIVKRVQAGRGEVIGSQPCRAYWCLSTIFGVLE
jgi:hypothetical protein